jgi:dephospho-CoA kinase
MNKKTVIFLGGLRGCGKTTILNYFKNVKDFKTIEFLDLIKEIYRSNKSWGRVEAKIGIKIKNLVKKYHKVMIAIHYAVPHESLIDDIRNNISRDYSHKYNPAINSNMIKNMVASDINFIFLYISVPTILLKKRLLKDLQNNPLRVSNNYLRNLTKIKKKDIFFFKKIISNMHKSCLNIKYFFIFNNRSLKNTISLIENKINNV